jgi:hypothetical protein
LEKLRLYELVCSVGSKPEDVTQQLTMLDQSKLDSGEIALLNAARLLSQGILVQSQDADNRSDIYGPSPAYPGMEVVMARRASVAQQFEATDAILNRVRK